MNRPRHASPFRIYAFMAGIIALAVVIALPAFT